MSQERALRIGIMLRSIDERGGIGVYTRYITETLLELDRHNHYVLLYRDPGNVGRFAHRTNVTERVVRGWGKAGWDQVGVKRRRRELLRALAGKLHCSYTTP